jgi:hypothetical protein
MPRLNRVPFGQMSRVAQTSMVLQPLAWTVFLGGQAWTYGTISLVQLAMGGLCCMLVFSLSNWGRWLSGAYNILLLVSFWGQGTVAIGWPMLTMVQALLFAGATIALFMPKTSAIFSLGHKVAHDQTPSANTL